MTWDKPVLLVVDDEPGIIRLIERFATKIGFKVSTATSGKEALAKIVAEKAVVALVDLRMPDVDGLEVLRGIRAADPDCQVILMTGHGSIETAIEAIKQGAAVVMMVAVNGTMAAVAMNNVRNAQSARAR